MCLGLPMQVRQLHSALIAECSGRHGDAEVNLALVGTVQPGDWLLVHLGTAREVLDAERAAQIECALNALEAAMRGQPVDAEWFADLDREPQLPPHLQGG